MTPYSYHLGIWLAIKMIPASVMEDSREKARSMPPEVLADKRRSSIVIITLWIVLIFIIAMVVYLIFKRK